MKKIIFFILFGIPTLSIAAPPDSLNLASPNLQPDARHGAITRGLTQILSNMHYAPRPLDDKMSQEIFKNLIQNLDNQKVYFLQSDYDEFKKDENNFDDLLKGGEVGPLFTIYNRWIQRIAERNEFALSLLKDSFNYTQPDSLLADREKANFCKTPAELNELWRKRVKYEAMRIQAGDKDWEATSTTLRNRYNRFNQQLKKTRSEDAFSALINSYCNIYDPHTQYFSPKQSEDFQISMSQSLEGIGATLQSDNEYTKIVNMVKGGPAERSKKLKPGDLITAVGQGKEGEMVDIYGWRVDEVVGLIRGPKDTWVRLQIKDATAGQAEPQKIVLLQRDKIKLEDQTAKAEIIERPGANKQSDKIGIIRIPTFYMDWEAAQRGDENYQSTSADVKRFLEDFRSKGVKGVVIDLRNNGGGSLFEAIQLSGLFIPGGAVVQVREANNNVSVERDYDGKMAWDGPLTVLVNRFSASASEIFAGAMQDYGRGIIVGEQTFGKGTVQNMLDLDRVLRMGENNAGQLKLTKAKFYRVNGSSTQHKGIIPDVALQSLYGAKDFGEGESPYALPWDQIKAAGFTPTGEVISIRPAIVKNSTARLEKNPLYANLLEDIRLREEMKNRPYISLRMADFKAEQEANKKRQAERKKALGIEDDAKTADINDDIDDELKEDTGEVKEDITVRKDIDKTDLILSEGLYVLQEIVTGIKK